MGKRIAVFTATFIAIAVALGLAVQEAPLPSDRDPSIMTDTHFELVEEAAQLACECEQAGGDACYSSFEALIADYPLGGSMDSGAPYYTQVYFFETDSGPQGFVRYHIAGGTDFPICNEYEAEVFESHFNAASPDGGGDISGAFETAVEAVKNNEPPIPREDAILQSETMFAPPNS